MRRRTIAALVGLLTGASTLPTPALANETNVEALRWFMVNVTTPI
jgi:hypothetical protein